MNGRMYKGFKKVAEDKNSATMAHEDGHQIRIAKSGLSPVQKKMLEALPLYQDDPEAPVGETADSSSYEMPISTDFSERQPQADNSSFTLPISKEIPDTSPLNNGRAPVQGPSSDMAGQDYDPSQTMRSSMQAEKNIGDIKQKEYGEQANLLDQNAKQQKDLRDEMQENYYDMMDEIEKARQDYHDGAINDKHYVQNMSIPAKIATAISLTLGGFSAGLTGGRNPGLDFLNSQIDRDLQAQKENQQQKGNILSHLVEKYKNQTVADHMFKVMDADIIHDKMLAAAARSNSAQAKQNGTLAANQFIAQYAPLVQKANALHLATKGSPGNDPSPLVPHLVPEGQQKDVYKEIADAQNAAQNEGDLLGHFDQAAKDVRFTKGGSPLYSTVLEPPSSKSMDLLAGPLLHDKDGRPNEFAIEGFRKMKPQAWDSDETVAQKRAAFQQFINSKKAAPMAKAYGIDLSRFSSTNGNNAQAPVMRKTQDGRTALFNPKTKQFLGYK